MVNIDNLSFGYRKKRPLFRDLNLRLERGHIYGLLGKNGAGKSTLLKMMCGLLFPGTGTCATLGYKARQRRPGMLSKLFIVPEEFYLPDIGIDYYLKTYTPFYPDFNRQEFELYLSEFDIPAAAHLGRLSYGQRKKVLISFGLATDVPLLLLDEPTNGLDIPSKSIFRRLIASGFHENRLVVISTHQVRDLDNLIDTMIVLHGHKIVLNHTVEDILAAFYFGSVADPETCQDEIIYAQNSLRGYDTVMRNTRNQSSKMDMELFFNAITSDPDAVQTVLAKTPYYE